MEIATKLLPRISDQWINVQVFDRLAVSVVVPLHAPTPCGLSDIDPVGCPVAGSTKAVAIHQSLQQQRTMAVVTFPILRELASAQREDFAGESFDADPRGG
jgi:hypothetical protein